MLNLPSLDLNANIEDIVDWIELKAFVSGNVLYSDIESVVVDNQDVYDEDISSEDDKKEDLMSQIGVKLFERNQSVRDGYPFIADNDGVELKHNIQYDGYVYLFCLIISHLRTKGICAEQKDLLNYKIRDLFQGIATIAAVSIVCPDGYSYCLGFPRPNKINFLNALHDIYTKIGTGVVKQHLSKGTKHVKDGGIDIVAWSHLPGGVNHYLLGQVASGNNWDDKPIRDRSFHINFFENPPMCSDKCIRATFIPIIIGKEYKDNDEDYKCFLYSKEADHGKIIFRERIAYLAGLEIRNKKPECEKKERISRYDDLRLIKEWVEALH